MAADTLLDRAAELKQQLVQFSQSGRYDRAFRNMLAEGQQDAGLEGEEQAILLWDSFLLEHRLRDGRTVVEQFVESRPDLSPQDCELLLGWRDVVTGVFEVQRRDGSALVLSNLVDDLTYRTLATTGPSVFRRMPRRSFLLTRVVPLGDEWMFSGPTTVLRPADRDIACRLALEMTLRSPETAYRNPERLARARELQQAERERFLRFFGSDLVVVPGSQAQRRLDEFSEFSHAELMRAITRPRGSARPVTMTLPPEVVGAETVGLVFDEDDGLSFWPDFGLVEEAFADPELARHRRYRHHVLACLKDQEQPPTALRRLAERDPAKASALFSRLLKRKDFDWSREGEQLLRTAKSDYFARPHLPQITPVSDRLAAYARRR